MPAIAIRHPRARTYGRLVVQQHQAGSPHPGCEALAIEQLVVIARDEVDAEGGREAFHGLDHLVERFERKINQIARDRGHVCLESVAPIHNVGQQLGQVKVPDVQIAEMGDAQPMERFGQMRRMDVPVDRVDALDTAGIGQPAPAQSQARAGEGRVPDPGPDTTDAPFAYSGSVLAELMGSFRHLLKCRQGRDEGRGVRSEE